MQIDFFDYSLHPMIGMRLKIQSLTLAAKSVAISSIVTTGAYVCDATADVVYEKYPETGAMTIKVSGVIAENDVKKLDAALESLTRSHLKLHMNSVQLNSNGGNRSAAMVMGYTIRRYGLNTIVKQDAICHSACVYALIGGVQRYPFGEIGVHRTTFEETPKTDKNIELIVRKDIKRVERYVADMGISDRLADAILSTPSWFVRVINEREKYEWQVMGIERVQEEKLVNQFSRDKKTQRAKVLESMRTNYDSCLNEALEFNSTLFECLRKFVTAN